MAENEIKIYGIKPCSMCGGSGEILRKIIEVDANGNEISQTQTIDFCPLCHGEKGVLTMLTLAELKQLLYEEPFIVQKKAA